MTAKQIFTALQDVKGGSRVNSDAAKAGFLEWALTLPVGASATIEARRALRQFEKTPMGASAAQLFIAHLRAASQALPVPKRRGGASARRGVLH